MSSLSFQPIENGLYSAVDKTSPKVSVYWLLLSGTPPSGNVDAADTWNTYSGCHIFIPSDKPIQNPSAFVAAIKPQFGQPQPNTRWVSWISDPAGVPGTMTSVNANMNNAPNAQTIAALSLLLANVSVNIPAGSTLTFNAAPALSADTPALVLENGNSGSLIALLRSGTTTTLNPDNGMAIVPLSGPLAGAVYFDATWDRGSFYAFFMDDPTSWTDTPSASEVRYFYGQTGSEQSLRYPVFPAQAQSQDPTQQLALNVSLDPFNVWESDRTRFGLNVSQFAPNNYVLPTSNYFRSTDGHALNLVPQQGAGYSFGLRPKGPSNDGVQTYAYLAPVGVFDVEAKGGLAAGNTPTIKHIMCGLTGTEYLLAAAGATVEFVPGGNAYSPNFTAPSGNGGGGSQSDPCNPGGGGQPVVPGSLLTDDFNTPWIRINPSLSPPGGIDYGYAVQPEASVYYSTVQRPAGNPYTYPLALGCRVSMLQEGGNSAALVPVPMAPYGGVWSTGAATPPTPAVFKAFESQIIGSTRHATAPQDMVNGPTFFDPVTHQGVNGGYAKTPEGLLAQLNNNTTNQPGTLKTLFLAKSPNANDDPPPPSNRIQLDFVGLSGAVVSPALSGALMNDNLFMVVTNYDPTNPQTPLGKFDNEIQVGEWTFTLDVGYTTDQTATPKSILLFKFTNAFSVVDLVNNAAYWQNWQTFIGNDPSMVKTIQSQLNTYLCTASPNGPNKNDPSTVALFSDFWTKATDPQWTGILAINCGIDTADLPADLQDLLGGISGPLRAHHFGITVNRIEGQDSSSWTMNQSSMFAVIHYQEDFLQPPPPPPPTAFSFQVLKLNVLIENSDLAHFDSKIAVTIPQLFGTDVVLTTPSGDPHVPAGYNVIEVAGVYQKHGDTGTVVFDTTTPQVFSFKTPTSTGWRVFNEVYVTDAALVPVTSTTASGTTTVTSNFSLSGVLVFTSDVSAAAQKPGGKGSGLDIFSYGDATSTPAAGLGFSAYNIAMTTVIQNNIGHIQQIGPDLSAFRVTPATSTVRSGSVLAALPLKLTAFLQNPSSSGWAVTFDGQSGNTFAATYALQFQASLGSLGSLSAMADSLDVDMVLGWQPATGANNDQVWLLMVPPATMLGQLGFGIQGVLDTTFLAVELAVQTWPTSSSQKVYAIYFKYVQIQLLGLMLIPGKANFTLFANPNEGNTSNMGWLMTLAVEP